MEDILVKVCTRQIYDTHTDSHEEVLKGKVAHKGDHTYIIYTEEAEETTTTNRIKIDKNMAVSIRRTGSNQSNLHFEKNKPYKTFYSTIHGNIDLTFIPHVVDYKTNIKGYTLQLQYSVYMGEQKISENEYLLEIGR